MKKFFTYFFALAVLFSVAVSCNDEDDYKPAEPVSGPQVFFSADMPSTIELSDVATSFEINLLRGDASESVSFSLNVSGETEKFDIPTTVSFAAGAESAVLTVEYDPDDFEYDEFFEVTMSIPEEYSTPYGLSEYTFSAGKSAPWESLGMCTYTDDFIGSLYGSSCCLTYEVEIEENSVNPGMFRLVNPYDEKYGWNDPGDWDPDNDYYLIINAVDPDRVYIPECDLGVDWGYGNIVAWSMADYYMEGGYTADEVAAEGYFGTYKDGVITFPQNTLLVYEMEDLILYYGNYWGYFKVVMPGVVVGDYSIEVDYVGKYTDTKDANYAIGEVTFVGEDVAYAHVALVEGKDGDAAVAAIKDGEVDCVEITESGNVLLSCEETGNYTIAVVSYSEAGEAQDSDYVTFKFEVGEAETWSLYGTGDYEYSVYLYGSDPGLELYQSDANPNNFKIEHWAYDVDFYFTWDQDTNEVVVEEDQPFGTTYGNYGDILVDDLSDYFGVGGGTYSNGTFYFAMAYYVSAGYLGFGVETFTLEGTTPDTFTVDDLVGTYLTYGVSDYGPADDEEEDWKFEASDDSSKGNFMITNYNGWENYDAPIYGTLDEDGLITIDTGTDGVFFYNDGTCDYYFVSYYAYYYDGYYGTELYMTLLPNGTFIGPIDDYICELMYYDGSPYAWNQIFDLVAGTKYGVSPNALVQKSKECHAHSLNEVHTSSLMAPGTKAKFEKPAIAAKTASVEQQKTGCQTVKKDTKKVVPPIPGGPALGTK